MSDSLLMRMTVPKLVSYALVRPGVVLLALLMAPLPVSVDAAVVQLCDRVLFMRPHPYLPVTLFALIVGASSAFLALNLRELRELTQVTGKAKNKYAPQLMLKIALKERNAWMSAFSLLLIVCIHQFRHMVKRELRAVLKNNVEKNDTTTTTSAGVITPPTNVKHLTKVPSAAARKQAELDKEHAEAMHHHQHQEEEEEGRVKTQ